MFSAFCMFPLCCDNMLVFRICTCCYFICWLHVFNFCCIHFFMLRVTCFEFYDVCALYVYPRFVICLFVLVLFCLLRFTVSDSCWCTNDAASCNVNVGPPMNPGDRIPEIWLCTNVAGGCTVCANDVLTLSSQP